MPTAPLTETRHQKYYRAHKAQALEYRRKYYQANKERLVRYSRDYYAANKSQCNRSSAVSRFPRLYGITADDYKAMYAAQGGLCAICEQFFDVLHVDHNHKTTVVRALLCGSCNNGLGRFFHSPERLNRAAEYLDNHGHE